MENEFFKHDGMALYSKVTGKKVATAREFYYNVLGLEECVKLYKQGALVKNKICALIKIKFIKNNGSTLFEVNTKRLLKYIYDLDASVLSAGVLLSYRFEKNFFYEYRTFNGKKFSSNVFGDLVKQIKGIEKMLDGSKNKTQKTEPVMTNFLLSTAKLDKVDREYEDEEEQENL